MSRVYMHRFFNKGSTLNHNVEWYICPFTLFIFFYDGDVWVSLHIPQLLHVICYLRPTQVPDNFIHQRFGRCKTLPSVFTSVEFELETSWLFATSLTTRPHP